MIIKGNQTLTLNPNEKIVIQASCITEFTQDVINSLYAMEETYFSVDFNTGRMVQFRMFNPILDKPEDCSLVKDLDE